jgi:hypothetical protein
MEILRTAAQANRVSVLRLQNLVSSISAQKRGNRRSAINLAVGRFEEEFAPRLHYFREIKISVQRLEFVEVDRECRDRNWTTGDGLYDGAGPPSTNPRRPSIMLLNQWVFRMAAFP